MTATISQELFDLSLDGILAAARQKLADQRRAEMEQRLAEEARQRDLQDKALHMLAEQLPPALRQYVKNGTNRDFLLCVPDALPIRISARWNLVEGELVSVSIAETTRYCSFTVKTPHVEIDDDAGAYDVYYFNGESFEELADALALAADPENTARIALAEKEAAARNARLQEQKLAKEPLPFASPTAGERLVQAINDIVRDAIGVNVEE